MKSIAQKEITVKIPYSEKEFTIEPMDVYDEFELDVYFDKFIITAQQKDNANLTVFEFVSKVLGSKEEVIKFSELGKRLVRELKDSPLFEVAITFFDIIYAIDSYKNDLKKK